MKSLSLAMSLFLFLHPIISVQLHDAFTDRLTITVWLSTVVMETHIFCFVFSLIWSSVQLYLKHTDPETDQSARTHGLMSQPLRMDWRTTDDRRIFTSIIILKIILNYWSHSWCVGSLFMYLFIGLVDDHLFFFRHYYHDRSSSTEFRWHTVSLLIGFCNIR